MSAVEAPRRPRASIGPALLRRGWLLLVSMVALGALAYAVAGLQSATYTAQATLNVSPALGPAAPTNAQEATQLATTYAGSIPDDELLARYVAQRSGARSGSLSARTSGRGSVLRVTYSAPSRTAALAGGRAAGDALSSDAKTSSSVTPGSLQLVRHPTAATRSGGGWSATSVLVVPGAAPAVNADQANKLAATYAGVIAADDGILQAVGNRLHESRDDVASNLSIVNEQNTSILQVSFSSDTPAKAAAGARSVARLVSGARPAAASILPSSLQTISLPRATGQPAKDKTAAIPIGVILGLLLGFVLLVAWERSDPHVRSARDLSAHVGCPATPIDRLSAEAAYALAERWAGLTNSVPAHAAILPADGGTSEAADEAVKLLVASGEGAVRAEDARISPLPDDYVPSSQGGVADLVLVQAPPVGGESAGQAVALNCDLTVVVVRQGVKAAEVRALAQELSDFGIVPAWALLVPRRGFRAPARATDTADALAR